MALELFPTPSWPRPSFYIPLGFEPKRFPGKAEMAPMPLKQIEGSPSEEVRSYWACDTQHLLLALELPLLPKSQRWDHCVSLSVARQTDSEYTSCYNSLDFTNVCSKPQILTITSNGYRLPRTEYNRVKLKLSVEEGLNYLTVAIPWSILPPLRPLLYSTIALNLSIVQVRGEAESALFQLVPDTNYETDDTDRRRLLPVGISPLQSSNPHAQSFLTCNLWQGNRPLRVNLGLYNPQTCPAKLEITVKRGSACQETHSSTVELGSGCHHWTLHWSPQRPLPSGEYILELGGQGCGKTYLKKHPFFVVDPAELVSVKNDLLKLEQDINCLHPIATHTALANLNWMEEKCGLCTWDQAAYHYFLQAKDMRDQLHNGLNPLEDKPGLSRRAFRSQKSGSLQSYSLYLPKGFKSNRKWPLLMLLHGCGPDEQDFAADTTLHKAADRLGLVLVFPSASSGKGFYLNVDETDIIQNLVVVKQSLPLDWDKLFIGGFGSGGISAWHNGLGHPEHFSGMAIISDATDPPLTVQAGFDPKAYPDALAKIPLLLLCGSKGKGAAEREPVASLKAYGAQLTCRNITADSAGNTAWVPPLASWLKTLLK